MAIQVKRVAKRQSWLEKLAIPEIVASLATSTS
mgnify:CR=1 FL=1